MLRAYGAVLRAVAASLIISTLSHVVVPAQENSGGIFFVSRERILREAEAAKLLARAEQDLTRKLQTQVDRTKEALAEEERALAQLRISLPEAEFAERVAAFDKRVRLARKLTQERAAALQRAFQAARQKVVDALPPLLEEIRLELNAVAILNSDQALAIDGTLDITARVIERFDMIVEPPQVPDMDTSKLLFELPGAGE